MMKAIYAVLKIHSTGESVNIKLDNGGWINLAIKPSGTDWVSVMKEFFENNNIEYDDTIFKGVK